MKLLIQNNASVSAAVRSKDTEMAAVLTLKLTEF